ncbi:MAG: hypothetical protein RLZZ214_1124 [Verrucomicrobiota bacterium]|jgi:hypothetical protein
MNTRRFVSGSSILLAGWLGATFLNEVPSQRYPKLDKKPATAAVDVAAGKLEVVSVSDSR